MKAARTRSKAKFIKRRRTPHADIQGMANYFAQQPAVVVAYLFGSVARGRGDHFSDVDIAVLFDNRVDVYRRGDLRLQFSADLRRYADRDVQVVGLNDATPVLKMQVLRDGKLLYTRSPMERITFEVRAAKIYYDTLPLRNFQYQFLFEVQRRPSWSAMRSLKNDSPSSPSTSRI